MKVDPQSHVGKMMMGYVHMDPQYGGNPVQPEELAHAHEDDNVNVVVPVMAHHALLPPMPGPPVPPLPVPPPVSMQSVVDEFVEVTASDGCDIAWRSCGMYLRSLEKVNGKFRAKCVCCGAIIPGRIYRLIRHVENECQMIRPDIKDKYLSDLIDTGKDYVSPRFKSCVGFAFLFILFVSYDTFTGPTWRSNCE